jgi:hypothetical protein
VVVVPSTAGVVGVSTWSASDVAPASDEWPGNAEIEPPAHPMNAQARRQTRISADDGIVLLQVRQQAQQ